MSCDSLGLFCQCEHQVVMFRQCAGATLACLHEKVTSTRFGMRMRTRPRFLGQVSLNCDRCGDEVVSGVFLSFVHEMWTRVHLILPSSPTCWRRGRNVPHRLHDRSVGSGAELESDYDDPSDESDSDEGEFTIVNRYKELCVGMSHRAGTIIEITPEFGKVLVQFKHDEVQHVKLGKVLQKVRET